MKNHLLLGCGWLGLPLAAKLLSEGAAVWGTTSSQDRVPVLKKEGIHPVLVNWNEVRGNNGLDDMPFFDSIIITIPPGGADLNRCIDLHRKISVYASLFQSGKWIYCSSTSIYEASEGLVREEDGSPVNRIGILEAIYSSSNANTTILRFGGLVGKDRHPIVHLAKGRQFEKPNAPVNLTSLSDALAALTFVIEHETRGVFNAVNPEHPSRYAFYSAAAAKKGLQMPTADLEDLTGGKIVSGEKFLKASSLSFRPLSQQDL